jgi:hypothetical protein
MNQFIKIPELIFKKFKKALVKIITIILYTRYKKFFSTKADLFGITYDNEKQTDGAGAQLQRIYGIYAVSRFLNLNYVHSPLSKVDYLGITAVEKNSSDQGIVGEYNKTFCLPSDITPPENHIVHELKTARIGALAKLKKQAEKNNTFILCRISQPYGISDIFPECYHAVKEISPFPSQSSPVIRIAVHVRRGELFAVYTSRMLPNAYYINVMERIRRVLEQHRLEYEFEIYTELPTNIFTVTPNHYGMRTTLASSVVIDPKANKLEDFDAIPNLKKFINTDPIETLQRMATANVLVMSHSSFSYLASMLNLKGTIIYHRFQHSPLKQWLIANDSGSFPEDKFLKQLKKSVSHHRVQRG